VRSCPLDVQLNNWETKNLLVVFNLEKIYDDRCFENINVDFPNFEHPVDNMEDDYEDGWEPSLEMLRLVEHEAKEIKPHQEMLKCSTWEM